MRALVAGLVLAGCVDVASEHRCRNDDDCVRTGITGRCEPTGNCSFADTKCGDNGYRYDVNAGPRAGVCVIPAAGPTSLDPIDLKRASDDTRSSCAVDGARNAYVELDSPTSQVLVIDTLGPGTTTATRLALREGACGDPEAAEQACAGATCGPSGFSRLVASVGKARYCLVIEEEDPAASEGSVQLRLFPARRDGGVLTEASGTVSATTCNLPPVGSQCSNPMAGAMPFLLPMCPGTRLSATVTPASPLDAVLSIRHGVPDDPSNGACVDDHPGQQAETFASTQLPAPDALWLVVSSSGSCGAFSLTYSVGP